tara:strand:- start:311 stop:550 length:240 start_codon:yes stop_codon:yes gene_type:complete
MKKLVVIITACAATFVWYGFQGGSVKEKTFIDNTSILSPANLTGADLTGANLRGVDLDGVILCNTIMPDGSINNSSCKK